MASSLVEAPSSSVERVNNKIASPPPLDDDDDDDEFSRLLNAHKKARGDPGGAPRLNQSSTVGGISSRAMGKRQRVADYGDIDGVGSRRYTSENPRYRGGRAGPQAQRGPATMGLLPPRPLRFPFPPYCGPLAKLVSSGPPPPLPADERSLMMKELVTRIRSLTAENERLTRIMSDQQRLLQDFGCPPPLLEPPVGHRSRNGKEEVEDPTEAATRSPRPAKSAVLPPWRSSSKKASTSTPTGSHPPMDEDLPMAPAKEGSTGRSSSS
ncbi:hypothetical protein Pmar_PMAR020638 [Perkinsus marinus ATCC 50983]|uniref:Uncharacterized protein n=1 Tax=Perkinsus marinus (strain ATCC 50983 / TXsc) TaxID=423536 RepID=C5L7L2_PERM5|nr:hypothetical protein Pmar_PMAR020638 [Perkinsus marinus ATCC 50983]EER07474.1 hypothetical protein Pmar_PMAR020638 [Perkinsus marinus ATCC 50983]|eukprot:XP_002775658.1 hypothetical protein Pmar_PMAR020638 [Perkinsus marinus ATCC 50983]